MDGAYAGAASRSLIRSRFAAICGLIRANPGLKDTFYKVIAATASEVPAGLTLPDLEATFTPSLTLVLDHDGHPVRPG
jgi:hypothetical protein